MLISNSVLFVFVPLTLHNLFIKSSAHCNPSSVFDLATCVEILQILSDRYEVGDYFMDLVNASLAIAQDMCREGLAGNPPNGDPFPDSGDEGLGKKFDAPLPPSNVHSLVIRFQDMALATGQIKTSNVATMNAYLTQKLGSEAERPQVLAREIVID